MAHVGANVAELEATLNRYRQTLVEIETHMSSIYNVADGLDTMGQKNEIAKLEEALTSCAKSHMAVSNQIKAISEARVHPKVSNSSLR